MPTAEAVPPVSTKTGRDPRSLFEIDERLVELLERAEEAAAAGEIPEKLLQEMNDFLEAFRTKVDGIAGYWRWQESIAAICGEEAERLSARKRAADRRVSRLKEMVLAFLISRGLKRIEGDKATISLQANSNTSLVIDDPSQMADCFFERSLRFTKTELQEITYQLADGNLRCRLESALSANGWEINHSAVRLAMTSNCPGLRSETRERPPCAPEVRGKIRRGVDQLQPAKHHAIELRSLREDRQVRPVRFAVPVWTAAIFLPRPKLSQWRPGRNRAAELLVQGPRISQSP